MARRFVIRANAGFLAVCAGIGGQPVDLVANALDAVRFVDLDTAAHRARMLTRLGWTDLRLIEISVPLV